MVTCSDRAGARLIHSSTSRAFRPGALLFRADCARGAGRGVGSVGPARRSLPMRLNLQPAAHDADTIRVANRCAGTSRCA